MNVHCGLQIEVKERSAFVNEELLLFFFKIDLGTRLQRALNLDRYDDAQALRAKIEEVCLLTLDIYLLPDYRSSTFNMVQEYTRSC